MASLLMKYPTPCIYYSEFPSRRWTANQGYRALPALFIITLTGVASGLLTVAKDYIFYVNGKYRHNTRASANINLFIPLFRTNSGQRTFYASANRLWNTLDYSTRSTTITTLRNFKKYLSNKYLVNNSKLDHFTVHRTF